MNSVINKIFLWTSKLNTNKKTFIIPTKSGLIWIGLTLYCLVAGMIFSNNLVITLGFILLLTIAFCSITTNFYIHDINFKNLYLNECHADQKMTIRLESTGKIVFENIQIKIMCEGSQFDFNFKERKDDKLTYQASRNIPRGKYQLIYLQYSTNYPLGLFYSWKSINLKDQYLFSYPVAEKIQAYTFAKPLLEDKKLIELGVDEFQKYQKGDERNLNSGVDLKRYFSKDEVWIKKYQKVKESKYLLNLSEIHQNSIEEDLGKMAGEILKLAEQGKDWEIVGTKAPKILSVDNKIKSSLRKLAEFEI